MKRIFGGIIVATLGIAVILAVPFASVSAANTNNFRINQYDIEYRLLKDSENRSVLETKEKIVTNFTIPNQNHGIERAIPTNYNGHSTSLAINGVTDGAGQSRQFTTYSEYDNMVLRIGDPDTYVLGTETYELKYSQRDVTRFYEDTDRDEWYWDTNGVDWQVRIDQLNVKVTIDPSLVSSLKAAPFCYEGVSGSTSQCDIRKIAEGEYTVSASNLRAGENVTLAFGFAPKTFAVYEPTLFERLMVIWQIVTFVTLIMSVIALIAFIATFYRRKNRTNELHTIPVQYIPPKNTSVIVAAQVVTPKGSVFAAQLMDFAVRHIISIVETKPKGTWTLAEYKIVILQDPTQLMKEEQEILSDMFGYLPKVNAQLDLSKLRNNPIYGLRTSDNDKKVKALLEGEYALRHKSPRASKLFYNWAIVLGIIGVLTVSIPLIVLTIIVIALGVSLRPLTDTGLEIRRYLLGLDKYIKAAETERIAFLQAPDTADKVGEKVDTENPGQILKLYERVLPYAVFFGHEKQWTKRLGDLYEAANTSPDWYQGASGFNAALFVGAMSSFSTTATYSGGSSSSSGGSSGGGSSGGGGGGGGGGGW